MQKKIPATPENMSEASGRVVISEASGRTVEIGDGLQISRIVHGLWQVADQERLAKSTLDLSPSAKAMESCAAAGYSTFDMADHYGSAEQIVGQHRMMRQADSEMNDIVVFTKWCPKPDEMAAEAVEAGVDRSLSRMKCGSAAGDAGVVGAELHLMQFHWWDYLDPRYLDALAHMNTMREQGRFRNLGLTNFDTAHLRVAVAQGVTIATNQVCFSLLDMRAAGAMSEFCLEHGIKLLAFGTVAGGFLTDKWLGKPEPESVRTWSEMKYKRFIDIWTKGEWSRFQELLRALRSIADKHSTDETQFTVANVAVRLILDQPAVASVIVGLRLGESEHMKDNEQVYALQLDEDDRAKVEALQKGAGTVPGDCGDEYRKPPFLTASGDLSDHLEMLRSGAKRPASMYGLTRVGADAELDVDGVGEAAGESAYDGCRWEIVKVQSGSQWEALAGFCRAVRRGNRILVSGTTATYGTAAVADVSRLLAATADTDVGEEEKAKLVAMCARAQTTFVLDKIEASLRMLGASGLSDVSRTRLYVPHTDRDWLPIALEHGLRFSACPPANTLVGAELVGEADQYQIEIEAEAEV